MEAQNITFGLFQVASIVFSVGSVIGVYWSLKIKFENMKTANEKDIQSLKAEDLSLKAGKNAYRIQTEKETGILHKRVDKVHQELEKHKEKTDTQFREVSEKLNIIIGKLEK